VNDIDISLTYMAPRDRYELVVGGTNITNHRYLTTGNEDYASGLIYGTYNPPGEWYLKLRAKF
jgi:iron complex outermembrane receptor protein